MHTASFPGPLAWIGAARVVQATWKGGRMTASQRITNPQRLM